MGNLKIRQNEDVLRLPRSRKIVTLYRYFGVHLSSGLIKTMVLKLLISRKQFILDTKLPYFSGNDLWGLSNVVKSTNKDDNFRDTSEIKYLYHFYKL